MPPPIQSIEDWSVQRADTIIDVRSPKEFKLDHIPGALNLPVLSDQQHEIVGRAYKTSKFEARKLGAGFILNNMKEHLEGGLKDKPRDFCPLIYCARGGQRSKSFATICSEIGWKCSILKGGYKRYRASVIEMLNKYSEQMAIIVISGRTGTGKTEILTELEKLGENIIDLEKLACHRGSLLGSFSGVEQPRQKYFETLLCKKIKNFNLKKPVFLEAESSKIGSIQIPKPLWVAMRRAPQVLIKSDRVKRAKFLVKSYHDLQKNSEKLLPLFQLLERSQPSAVVKDCREQLRAKDWEGLAITILNLHYDKRYDQAMMKCGRKTIFEIELTGLNQQNFRSVAKKLRTISHLNKKSGQRSHPS